MIGRFAWRMLRGVDARLLAKFAWNCGWQGMRAVQRFQRRLKTGEYFPAFLFISITNRCNLRCQGCWVTPSRIQQDLDLPTLDRIIRESRTQGGRFFGILGGEPLLHKGLNDIFRDHPDCYFLLFTNGLLITDEVAREWRRLGNVSPLISIEGDTSVSDLRRGGERVLERSLQGLAHCRRNRLIFGAATSVCRSNLDALVNEAFVRSLIDAGAHYLWYYLYRPVGPDPSPELVLSAEQIVRVRRFMVDIRPRVPLMVIDSYWDHEGRAMCPAAVGISHHINPLGQIEPCPPIQFSKDVIHAGQSVVGAFRQSAFLKDFRETVAQSTRGCVLMENPALLHDLVVRHGALDTTGRGTGLQEILAMGVVPSHHVEGEEIPESYWPYRLAKKRWFFGFGAYG